MSNDTIQERVARGAAWLDSRHGGWRDSVNLDDFTIGSCARCVLGQVLGDFSAAPLLDEGLTTEAHGFMWKALGPEKRAEIAELNAEWRRVIHQGRVAVEQREAQHAR